MPNGFVGPDPGPYCLQRFKYQQTTKVAPSKERVNYVFYENDELIYVEPFKYDRVVHPVSRVWCVYFVVINKFPTLTDRWCRFGQLQYVSRLICIFIQSKDSTFKMCPDIRFYTIEMQLTNAIKNEVTTYIKMISNHAIFCCHNRSKFATNETQASTL